MAKPISFIFSLLMLVACNQPNTPNSQIQFDSAHSRLYVGTIDDGFVYVDSSYVSEDGNFDNLQYFVEQQLMYTIGQYNGINGGPDVNKTKVSIQEVSTADETTGLVKVSYKAELQVSLPREHSPEEDYTLILPYRGDYAGLSEFFSLYGNDKESKACLDWAAHDVTQGIHWYYYRPERTYCELDPKKVVRFKVKHRYSQENTRRKYPEYRKIWEDGKLINVAIFGKAKKDGDDWDAGVQAYRSTYKALIREFGHPIETNLEEGQKPNLENHTIKVVFETDKGIVENHLFLVEGIRKVDEDFIKKYNELTEVADFISYSGHSGLGANIRALARMGTFKEGQYQIFLINGCDTFAYVDESLAKAHQEVNPGFGPNKYLDIITNAMPSYFHENTRSNMAVIKGLVEADKTYRKILSGFDRTQRAAVTGEEDNLWPEAFHP